MISSKWNEHFYYDETSPSKLRWNKDIYTGKNHNRKIINRTDIAGTLNKNGYWIVSFSNKLTYNHKIIYEMFNGLITNNNQIDHINGQRSDNNISNLRLVTVRQNRQNMSMRKDNISGITGVNFDRIKNRWVSRWVDIEGNDKRKCFHVSTYGDYAKDEAIFFRMRMIQEMNNLGMSYTKRHGEK
jgi:hypothetical protein